MFINKLKDITHIKYFITLVAISACFQTLSIMQSYSFPLNSFLILLSFCAFNLLFFRKKLHFNVQDLYNLIKDKKVLTIIIYYFYFFITCLFYYESLNPIVYNSIFRSISQLLFLIPFYYVLKNHNPIFINYLRNLLVLIGITTIILAFFKYLDSFSFSSISPHKSISLSKDYNFFSLGIWIILFTIYQKSASKKKQSRIKKLKYFCLISLIYTVLLYTGSRRALVLTFAVIGLKVLFETLKRNWNKLSLDIYSFLMSLFLFLSPLYFNHTFNYQVKNKILTNLNINPVYFKGSFFHPHFRYITLYNKNFDYNYFPNTYYKTKNTPTGEVITSLMKKLSLFGIDNLKKDSTDKKYDNHKILIGSFQPSDGSRFELIKIGFNYFLENPWYKIIFGSGFFYHTDLHTKYAELKKKTIKGKYLYPHMLSLSNLIFGGIISLSLLIWLFKNTTTNFINAKGLLDFKLSYLFIIIYCTISTDIPQSTYPLIFYTIFFILFPNKK